METKGRVLNIDENVVKSAAEVIKGFAYGAALQRAEQLLRTGAVDDGDRDILDTIRYIDAVKQTLKETMGGI